VSQITRGRETKSQRRVKVEGVWDHADVERARGRVVRDVVGVDSLEARFEGEDFGEDERSGGGKLDGWERVETIFRKGNVEWLIARSCCL
jgi:hypothetical protein